MRRPRHVQRWLATVLAVLFAAGPAWSLPQGAVVVSGNAQVSQTGPRTLQIVQLGGPVVIQWRSFSIASGELVRFLQPGPAALAVNRVTGGSSSMILGQLLANGRIVLVNPAGVTVGPGGLIKVAGLVATTLELRDADLRAGRLHLEQGPGGLATILNQGTIAVAPGGALVLVAPGVINQGTISAELGSVQLASGRRLVVDFGGDGLVRFAVDGGLERAAGSAGVAPGVRNEGRILADGGRVELTAKTAGDVLTGVVNNSGLIQARSLVKQGGVVRLIGGDDGVATATASGALRPTGEVRGVVSNTGTIDVSAKEAGAAPGRVLLMGERVGHGGTIDARGADGGRGGEVAIAATERAVLLPGSTIDVSGVGDASAGRVTVWSDRDTSAATGAALVARGGERGGHGGFVEVSAGESLGFDAAVDARAPAGAAGTLLLDPRNITVRTLGGVPYNPGVNNLFGNNVGATNIITPASINAAAANVVLQANSDITVTDPIAMTNAGVGVTMEAGRSIAVNANVVTNNGPITLISNAPGAVILDRAGGAGNITMGAGTTLNAGNQPISLTVGALAGGNPGNITAVNLTSSAGGITLSTPNAVTLNGVVNAGAGPVTIQTNTDGAAADSFLMNAGSSITTTNSGAGAVRINVNAAGGGTGTATIRNISAGAGGLVTVATNTGGNLTGGAITQVAATTVNGGALLSSANAITLNGVINAGAAPVTIQANTDGASNQSFLMNAGSSITTTNTGAGAVTINVNAAAGGTGTATTRDISTGAGGLVTVATNTGGNTTGGTITQVAATTLSGGALLSSANGITQNGAINAGPATVTIQANTDGAGAESFTMAAGSSIATTNTGGSAVAINVNAAGGGTGAATVRDISTGPGGGITVRTDTGGNLTGGTISHASGSLLSGGLLMSSPNAVSLSGLVNTGAGPVTIAANTDGVGNQALTMGAASTITTTNASPGAVAINVNAGAGGTGGAALGGITTGSGGAITVATNTGGNTTGGSITRAGGALATGAGSVVLTAPTTGASGVGTAAARIQTTAGSVAATAGTGGVFITESDGASFQATASGTGQVNLASTAGTLTIAGPTSTGSGAVTLASGDAVVLNANVGGAGSGTITINANTDGAGAEGFTQSPGATITTTNTSATAVRVNVNAAAGGTGGAALGSISTGSGGRITMATNNGPNVTGGSITQTAGDLLATGTGSVILTTPNAGASGIGTAATPIRTTANTVTVTAGSGGVFITETDGASFTVTATGTGPIGLTSLAGTLTIAGATTTGSGPITLSSGDGVTVNANLGGGAYSGPIAITANTNGAGAEGFTQATGASIATTNASPTAVSVAVNAAGGGTGGAVLGNITSGSGGTITVGTNAGGNATGGSITRTGATLLNAGIGTVALATGTGGASGIGTAATPMRTAAGTVTATAGSGGVFITETDGAAFTATATGPGDITLTSTTGTLDIAGPTSTGSGNITLSSGDAVALNANVGGGGSGTVTINANTNGAGAEGFTQSGAASITTTDATTNAVRVNVNAAAGGTGGATLGNVTTGSGGRITVATNTGGNLTGGSIDQNGGGLLDTGTGSVILTTPTAGASEIGTAGVPIRTTANTITATAGAGGVFVTETDGAAFTVTATGAGPISLASTAGTLTLAGATSSGTGPISLSGPTVVQNANLTTGGPITVTATAGPLTMGGATQSTAGGNITYQGAGDVTLGGLTSGAAAAVTSTGGSLLDGNGGAVNVTAGTTATLQAGNIIGSAADPLDIAVTGLANVNAGGVQAGDSIQINGTTGDNTLHFPLTVPGQIFFNGILLHPLAPPVAPPLAPPVAPPLAPPLAPVTGGASLGVYTQVIASCDLTAGAGDLVRFPASCAPGASAKGELAAPLPELPEPAP
jgi:filamentous hemagglutinin family protein